MKNFLGNKEFWETIRPFLSDKNTVFSQISIKKKKLYLMTLICLKIVPVFFEDAVRLLNVKPDEYYLSDTGNLNDLVVIAESMKTIQVFKLLSKIF